MFRGPVCPGKAQSSLPSDELEKIEYDMCPQFMECLQCLISTSFHFGDGDEEPTKTVYETRKSMSLSLSSMIMDPGSADGRETYLSKDTQKPDTRRAKHHCYRVVRSS